MEQHHRAAVGPGQELSEGLLPGRLGVVVPVHIGKAPENSFIPQLLGHLQIFFAVDPLGRTVVFGHLLSGGLLVQGFQILQLLGKSGFVGDLAHVIVVHGVVGDDVAFLHHPPHQVRVLLDVVAHQEKCGVYFLLFQDVQNFLRTAVFVACVKGQVQHLLGGVANVGGIKLL